MCFRGKTLIFYLLVVVIVEISDGKCTSEDIPEWNYLDFSVNPCDNFYKFACGNFENVHPKPETEAYLDHFVLLKNHLLNTGKHILNQATHSLEPMAVKKAKAAYQGCLDVNSVNQREKPAEFEIIDRYFGFPLLEAPDKPQAEFSWPQIGDMVGRFGVQLIFQLDIVETNQTSGINLSQDKLVNPSLIRPDFELGYDHVIDEGFMDITRKGLRVKRDETVAPFDEFLRTTANFLADFNKDYRKTPDEIIEGLDDMALFMRTLYQGGILEEGLEIPSLESPTTVKQLQDWTNLLFESRGEVINWKEFLGKIFVYAAVKITDETKVYISNPKYIYGALNLVSQTDSKIVKNFALLRIILFLAPDSGTVIRQAFEKYYQAKNYKLYKRDDYCVRKILDATDSAGLSFAVTYDYQKYYFDINRLSEAANMVDNLTAAFLDILADADWMDDTSSEMAQKKATKILTLLGYPDFVTEKDELNRFYDNFRICQFDNYGNSYNLRAFKQAYRFTVLDKNSTEFWSKSTFDTNAYYNRPGNKIVLPISMLNDPYFPKNNTLLAYSRLGSILGHEITHGFDNLGRGYSDTGLLVDWWSPETVEAFQNRANCFIDQYNQYHIPEIDSYVNGTLSLNENLADNGGVRTAFKAYEKLVKSGAVKRITGDLTWQQIFFLGYGTSWCTTETNSYLSSLVNGAYARAEYRVNGPLSNMAEFSEAFQCPRDSPMNRPSKCILW